MSGASGPAGTVFRAMIPNTSMNVATASATMFMGMLRICGMVAKTPSLLPVVSSRSRCCL